MRRPLGLAIHEPAGPAAIAAVETLAAEGLVSVVEPSPAAFNGPGGDDFRRGLADLLASSDHLSAPTFLCSAGEAYDISLPDDSSRMDAVERFIGEMKDAVSAFDSRTIVVRPSAANVADSDRAARLSALKESLSEIEERIRHYGARIALGLLSGECLGNTPEELLEIASDFGDGFGFCLDAGLMAGAPRRLAEAALLFGERLYDVHFPELPANGGSPGWDALGAALDAAGYRGPVVCGRLPGWKS